MFVRTHDVFDNCWVYYCKWGDAMEVVDGKLKNKDDDDFVCWTGQQGVFEGLRQKGWWLQSLLVIRAVCEKHETKVKVIAQGDD